MADSSSDDDMLRSLQIQTIAVAMQMRRKNQYESSKTLLHAVDIRTEKRSRRLPPVSDNNWKLGTLSIIPDISHDPRYPGRYSVSSWSVATTWCIHFCHDNLL